VNTAFTSIPDFPRIVGLTTKM